MNAHATPPAAITHFFSGAFSEGLTTATTQPFETVIMRSRLSRDLRKEGYDISLRNDTRESATQGEGNRTVDDSIATLLAREGGLALPSLHRIFLEGEVARRSIETGVFFGTYAALKGGRNGVYRQGSGPQFGIPAVEELGLCLLCGTLGRAVGVGISNLSLPMPKPKGLEKDLRTLKPRQALLASLKSAEYAANNLFRGFLSENLVGAAVEPGLTLAFEEFAGRILVGDDRKNGLVNVLILAVVGKVLAILATYPFRTARARLRAAQLEDPALNPENHGGRGVDNKPMEEQLIDLSDIKTSRSTPGEKPKYGSLLGAVRRVYRAEGFFALYDGIGHEILRSVIHHSVLMVGKELVHRLILRFAFVVASLRNLKLSGRCKSAGETNHTLASRRVRHIVPDASIAEPKAVNIANKTSEPGAPSGSRNIRMLHTGKSLPLPGERLWNMPPQRPPGTGRGQWSESHSGTLGSVKPWDLGEEPASVHGNLRANLRSDRPSLAKWTDLFTTLSWRRKQSTDGPSGPLVANLLGDGSRVV